MRKHNFHIPERILQLFNSGIWPSTDDQVKSQDEKPLTNEALVRNIVADEKYMYFSSVDGFYTLSLEFDTNEVMREFGAIDQINAKECLIIGDFGIGSDSPIVLDYSENKLSPSVKRLVWKEEGNYWETIANTVDDFLDKLGL